jgi:hypothetical protein
MAKRTIILISALFVLLAGGCGPRILVPPAVNLEQFVGVGLIAFSSNAKGNLADYATQKFIEVVNKSQPNARIIELGREADVLKDIALERLGPDAMQAIGKKYNVNLVFVGNLRVSNIKPRVSIASIITHLSASAEVDADITVKLIDTGQGATIWTDSARDRRTVAHVSVFRGGDFFFDAQDPEEAYGKLIRTLIKDITEDFRAHYQRR